MRFGIPGTDIGFDLDIPNPVDYANEMLGKVKDLLNSVLNAIGGFFSTAMSNIGSGFRTMLTTVPKKVFSIVTEGVGRLWASLTGRF